jgi:DNA processing protein
MATLSMSIATPVSPVHEMGAYEALWTAAGAWFKNLAERFSQHPGALPSDLLGDSDTAERFAMKARELLASGGVEKFGVRLHGAGEYPSRLRDADFPIELLYYQGWWDLIEKPSMAVVGTRNPSARGVAQAQAISATLVADGYTVMSGLASGIDTAAHMSAIKAGGRTIAVIGTPLSANYPKENKDLQQFIAQRHLLISQVPVCRYSDQDYRQNRLFFPERNITMSALSEGTIIVEAGETSGTLTQARAALKQGRKLFILESCFEQGLKWPVNFLERGAIKVRNYEDIRQHLIGLPRYTPKNPKA